MAENSPDVYPHYSYLLYGMYTTLSQFNNKVL